MAPKRSKGILIYFCVFLLLMSLASALFMNSAEEDNTPDYNTVIGYFYDDRVTEYTLDFGTGELSLKLKDQTAPVNYKVPNISVFINDTHEYVT